MRVKKSAGSTFRRLVRHPVCRLPLAFLLFFSVALLFLRWLPFPSLARFLARPVSSRIYDDSFRLIQITALENGLRREYLRLEQIPPLVQHAFIMSEDKHFYSHHGVDAGAVIRAACQNIRNARTVSGASTITMQLARLIRPVPGRRTLLTKAREALDALRLEMRLSKAQILELYLNSVPFGANAEGVCSASRAFFGVEPGRLSDAQVYCLAVIPRRPVLYSPAANPDVCAGAALELYEAACREHALAPVLSAADFSLAAHSAKAFSYPFEMPHFVRYLTSLPDSPVGREADVYTSVDLQLQHEAESLLSAAVEDNMQHRLTNGAVLVCDSRTGAVLSWVGSTDFFDEEHNGQVDGVLVQRQPGSSMKPFLYALALESGFSPAAVLPDIPMEFGFERLYVPQNFNNRYNGPVRLRVALASSLNVPAVYLLNTVGMAPYLKRLRALGFDSLSGSEPGLGLALGNAEVQLFELVQAFSVFSRDGLFLPLTAFAGETERNYGRHASAAHAGDCSGQPAQVYDRNTARIICDMLSDADARSLGFGYRQTFQTPFPSMFKTGTANQYQNITALGATPDYTVGVWMGNFSGETVVGKTGSSVPARLARDILVLLQGQRGEPFPAPEQYKKIPVCSLSGMKAGDSCPGTVLEYVPAVGPAGGNSLPVCSWHTKAGESPTYPSEYEAWFHLKNRSGFISDGNEPLVITSPCEDSLFYYDDSVAPYMQRLVLEARGGRERQAEVYADGELLAVTDRPFTARIPVSRGRHHVQVVCGDEQADVHYQVR